MWSLPCICLLCKGAFMRSEYDVPFAGVFASRGLTADDIVSNGRLMVRSWLQNK